MLLTCRHVAILLMLLHYLLNSCAALCLLLMLALCVHFPLLPAGCLTDTGTGQRAQDRESMRLIPVACWARVKPRVHVKGMQQASV